jgi:hypothetical protein
MNTEQVIRRIVQLQILLSALALPALAAEVVVKNDSIVDFGQAVIVGDFIAGERAGVRLTSSCNGNIVAIQILWLEGTAGHGQSLEDSITIANNNSTFPTPGTILAFLEGPVMTPGVWNEFRYLDENQTIPVNVPVVAGQQFYVYLQFFNPTNVGGGGPSVVRDIGGCQAGKNVLYAIPGGWINFCLIIQGDIAIRAVINCAESPEACCFSDGTCQNKTPTDCATAGGTHQGAGTTCATFQCPQPTGACCLSNGNCLALTQANCGTVGGTWLGAGSACNGTLCPTGACCLPDGSCTPGVTALACMSLGGTFKGVGTNCATAQCPQPSAACCLSNGNCLVFTAGDCALVGGVWAGLGTDCADNNANGKADVCETTSCTGDMNCDGTRGFSDINPFVLYLSNPSSWHVAYPTCNPANGDINGDGTYPAFSDINSFVSLLSGSPPPCP